MSDHDRGAYTPQTDAPLAFDARAPRGARKPLPLALIGGGVLLLVLVAAVGMYYSSGVGPSPGTPPTVGQPVETVKSPPPVAEAPPENAAAESAVFAQAPAAPAPAFAPAPEQPKPRPAPMLSVQAVDNPPKPAPAPAPAPAMSPAKPVAVATAPVKPVPTTPALKPAAAPPPAKPVAVATAPVKPVPAAPAAAASGGPASVQIGAYSSTALADKGFSQASSEFPGFMVGKTKHVEPVARDGKTLYRTSVTGFPSKAVAQAFCDAWKAKGRPCFVKG